MGLNPKYLLFYQKYMIVRNKESVWKQKKRTSFVHFPELYSAKRTLSKTLLTCSGSSSSTP
jgi:hypothetical protein